MNNNNIEATSQKCTCVPSGRCHPQIQYLLGCPHPHHYNEKGVWTCGVDPMSFIHIRPTHSPTFLSTSSSPKNRPTQSSSYFKKASSSNFTIDMNPWGEYVVRKNI